MPTHAHKEQVRPPTSPCTVTTAGGWTEFEQELTLIRALYQAVLGPLHDPRDPHFHAQRPCYASSLFTFQSVP